MSGTNPTASLDERLARALRPSLASADGPVLLAVSGGPDSIALMHAASRIGPADRLFVATVDHGLRPEAAEEAAGVGRLAVALGLAHAVLPWESPRRGSRVQAEARAARYRLLSDHAARLGARLVMTGHTLDDQAETVLMRLIAGSAPAGLAGMQRLRPLTPDIRLARPFLSLAKAELVAYCEAQGLSFLRDPSNTDARFARARLRRLMPELRTEGLSAARLARLAERAARDESALAERADAVFAQIARSEAEGILLEGARLRDEPEAICLRVMDRALEAVASGLPDPVPKRLERLESLLFDALLPALKEGRVLRRTLRGVLIEADRQGRIHLGAAPPRGSRNPAR
ncbi:tRNA lysidine(34) synthetase TilS [Methylorubrum populi]|uniref:tRNA(Ile)-lysidine synthase n=1 Tax=Methylobacterium radiotolerans TaxID=31998 RepID=A0ABU7TBT9_9HYPH